MTTLDEFLKLRQEDYDHWRDLAGEIDLLSLFEELAHAYDKRGEAIAELQSEADHEFCHLSAEEI